MLKSDSAAANEAEVAIAYASLSSDAFEIDDSSAPLTDESLLTNPLARHASYDENPITRIQEEFALWTSPRMKDIRDTITEAALIDVTVLITGETGTGKELVARAIHYLGSRRNGPFVKVNCTSVTRELLESELFGHKYGALTEAHLKIGKFETANDGTIFLDEIGGLDPALQAKLLHVLEDGLFSRVDGRSNMRVAARVVAATNQNLETSVAAGGFREDLFYRLNVIRIVMPPLRKRTEEIPPLANYFVKRYSKLFQQEGFTLPPETMRWLKQHSFPGNVRELENMIKRIIVLRGLDLTQGSLVGETASGGSQRPAKQAQVVAGSLRAISKKAAQAAEQSAILNALEETRWNRVRAAKLLNISYRSLLYKIREAGLDGRGKASDSP